MGKPLHAVMCLGVIGMVVAGGVAQAEQEISQEQAAKQMEAAAQQMGQALAGVGQAFGAAQAGAAVELVNFRDLKALFKDRLGDLELVNASGETASAMGIKMSMAEGQYRAKNGETVKISVQDLGTFQGFSQLAHAWNVDIDRESDTEYERTFNWNGRRARKSYDSESKRGEFGVIAGGGRFMIEFSGYTADRELAAWEKAAGELDFRTLDGWKDYGLAKQ